MERPAVTAAAEMSSSEEGFEMGGRYIPKEVMCTILARLPVRAFVGVCKRWYWIVKDIEFQIMRQRLGAPKEQPFLLWNSNHVEQPYAYDLLLRHWLPFPLSPFARVAQNSPFEVHSSTSGLFLIKIDVNGMKTYATLNPLSGSYRLLPPMLEQAKNFKVIQMVMDDAVDGKFLILAEGGDPYVTDPNTPKIQIYDSIRNAWQMAGGLRPPRPRNYLTVLVLAEDRMVFRSAATLNGSLYCLAVTSRTAQVLKFDGTDYWHEIQAELPWCIAPQAMGSSTLMNAVMWTPHLFANRGRLMLVGAEFRKYHTQRRPLYGVDELVNLWRHDSSSTSAAGANDSEVNEGVHIWALDEEQTEWVHVHRMPENLFDDSVKSYEFRTAGDFLHVSPWPRSSENTEMLMANLATGCWEVFSEPPCYQENVVKKDSLLLQHTLYEPRLTAVA
ncbi:hypothetical protein Mapa_009297 [Marchantia paleacea]|nr:hypothetical protein Mapa_009297 [Marchantia paleacea]